MFILILDSSLVSLYRYDDPLLGPRSKPTVDDILKGKTQIPSNSVFDVDIENKNVNVNVGGSVHNIGNELIYILQSLEN